MYAIRSYYAIVDGEVAIHIEAKRLFCRGSYRLRVDSIYPWQANPRHRRFVYLSGTGVAPGPGFQREFLSMSMQSPSMTAAIGPPSWLVRWAAAVRRATDYLVQDFGGGPRPWKFAWVINFQKCGTFLFLGFLMWYYGNFSTAASYNFV